MSKPTATKSRQRLKPEERRAQLLTCAVEAYAKSGVERAGHGDVAKLAKVSTATVFNYFPTRNDLTEAVFNYIGQTVLTMFDAMPETQASTAEEIKNMSAGYRQITEDDPNMVKVFINLSASFNPEIRPYYLALQKHSIEQISARLPPSDRLSTNARIIMASANMMALMQLDGVDSDLIDRFVDKVAHAFG